MEPKFASLEAIFEGKRAYLQDNPQGLYPEQTLVLETFGSIDDFYRALRTTHGLEWMGEFDIDNIVPDEDFYDEEEPEARLSGRVYLIMHNQEGLQQLLSLWSIFRDNPEHPQFSTGRAKFRQLFMQLRDLRPWGHKDRLMDTGLLEDWQERVTAGQDVMRVEVELWPRRQRSWERPRAENRVMSLIEGEGGRVLARYEAAEAIAYHALLAELPIQAIQRVLEDPAVDLARCEQVMFFRPAGQVSVELPENPPQEISSPARDLSHPEGEPIAALLDGLPLSNHEWLAGRLIVDDPDRWEDEYPARSRLHGTAMASLIVHSELDSPTAAISRPLYVRPVMKPHPQDPNREAVPLNCLTVDLIHRAVARILDRDGSEPPVAANVRVINLSLGDRARPFDRLPSPWARLLDHLAVKYNVLFIVSAGNHPHRIELSLEGADATELLANAERLKPEVLRAVRNDNRNRRLLSPAEAINALTVGALHADASSLLSLPIDGVDPLAGSILPALYSAQGLGFRRAVKPDILSPGGRLLYRRAYGTSPVSLDPIDSSRPPGQKVATPGVVPGDVSTIRYLRGTSNAAAIVTHVACQLYDVLDDLRMSADGRRPEEEDVAILIRTLLVHGSSWGESFAGFENHLGCRRGSEGFSRICGLGSLEPERVLACTDQRVTLLGWGALEDGGAFAYTLPLPASLNSLRMFRRLTTTLAWFSPIQPRDHRYRQAHLWLSRYSGTRKDDDAMRRLGLRRVCVDDKLARRGTVQHEIYEGERASSFEEGEGLRFQVNCRSDAGTLVRSVRYGLAITLEVAEGTGLPIYEEVRTGIQPRPRITPPITP